MDLIKYEISVKHSDHQFIDKTLNDSRCVNYLTLPPIYKMWNMSGIVMIFNGPIHKLDDDVPNIYHEFCHDIESFYNGKFQYHHNAKLSYNGGFINHIYKFNEIIVLNVRKNYPPLKRLPDLPKLTWLNCNTNKLIYLPNYPNLTYLDVSHNELNTLPILPKLKYAAVQCNKLTKIIDYPNLTYLNVSFNFIDVLSCLPKLRVLICWYNKINILPDLPNLTSLACVQNYIIKIPVYPKLIYINCIRNPLEIGIYSDINHSFVCEGDTYYNVQNSWLDTIHTDKMKQIFTIEEYHTFNKFKQCYWVKKCFIHWQNKIKKRKHQALILACQTQYFNPDYDFYKRSAEYLHFHHQKYIFDNNK